MRQCSPHQLLLIMRRRRCVVCRLLCLQLALILAGASGKALAQAPYGYLARHRRLSIWSGLYLGAHLGGAWGSSTATDSSSATTLTDYWSAAPSGLVAGVQLGYNWQVGPLLYGIEGDLGNLGLGRQRHHHLRPLRLRHLDEHGCRLLPDAARTARLPRQWVAALRNRRLHRRRHHRIGARGVQLAASAAPPPAHPPSRSARGGQLAAASKPGSAMGGRRSSSISTTIWAARRRTRTRASAAAPTAGRSTPMARWCAWA